MTNLNKAKLNLKLAKIFLWVHHHFEMLSIRAKYRYKLYSSLAEVYISAEKKKNN